MPNKDLYEIALDAITELFSDPSVSVSDCKDNLVSLKSEIDTMLDSLQGDNNWVS